MFYGCGAYGFEYLLLHFLVVVWPVWVWDYYTDWLGHYSIQRSLLISVHVSIRMVDLSKTS